MTFLLILVGAAVTFLILQKQQEGTSTIASSEEPADETLKPMPKTPAEEMLYAKSAPQVLAFGKMTLGSEPSPALINMTPDKVLPGSAVPLPTIKTQVPVVSGFADPSMMLKTANARGDGGPVIGLSFEQGANQVIAGTVIAPELTQKMNNPLSALPKPVGTESTIKGGDIPPPAATTGSPTLKSASFYPIESPPPQLSPWLDTPATMGPPPVAVVAVATTSPVMPPKPVTISPPSPLISMPPAQVGSPITAQPTPLGPPRPAPLPVLIPSAVGTPSPVPVTSLPPPSPSFNPPPPPPAPIVPTSPARVTQPTTRSGVRTYTP